MDVFVIYSYSDRDKVELELKKLSDTIFGLNFLTLDGTNKFWKPSAKKKIKKAELVLCFIGENSYKSDNIDWEIRLAVKLDIKILCIKLNEKYKLNESVYVVDEFSRKKMQKCTVVTCDTIGNTLLDNNDLVEKKLFELKKIEDTHSKDVLFEQYKLMYESSEKLMSRRQQINNVYITVNSLLLPIIATFLTLNYKGAVLISAMLSLIISILNISWSKTIESYGQLNAAKYLIMEKIEKHLSANLFSSEWISLSKSQKVKKYVSFTTRERLLPKMLGTLDTILLVVATTLAILKFIST